MRLCLLNYDLYFIEYEKIQFIAKKLFSRIKYIFLSMLKSKFLYSEFLNWPFNSIKYEINIFPQLIFAGVAKDYYIKKKKIT